MLQVLRVLMNDEAIYRFLFQFTGKHSTDGRISE